MSFTEQEYEDFLDKVDPDDIKELWELPSNPESFKELCDLHEQSKKVLDYFGIPEFNPKAVNNLAVFILNLQEFIFDYEMRNEVNIYIVEKTRVFMSKIPVNLNDIVESL